MWKLREFQLEILEYIKVWTFRANRLPICEYDLILPLNLSILSVSFYHSGF